MKGSTMSNLFANLKRNSSDTDKLKQAIESINAPTEGSNDDKNYWRPAVDKAGNGMATFRFLPAPAVDHVEGQDEPTPWAKIWSHGFQGPGGQWLVDNCLTTKGEKCPVCEHNTVLWNSGIQANRDIVSKQKRKLNYVSNVYIVSDPKNPENEGRVVLFKYGKKIFDKIQEALNPQFPDEPKINAFDMWGGANFKLKIRKVEGYANYDKSEFDTPSRLKESDDELKKIWESEFSLKEIVSDSKFKTFETIQKRLNLVLGLNGESQPQAQTTVEKFREEARTAPQRTVEPSYSEPSLNEDDPLDYFKNLAEED